MSISQYSPDGKFESGSFMNGMWSGPQGTNPNQGLMGLGQQPLNLSGGRNFMPNALGSAYEPTRQPQGNMSQFEFGVPPDLPNGYLDYTSSFGRQFGLGGNDTPSALTPQQWMANKPSAYNSGDANSFNPPNYMGQQPQAPYNNGKLRYDSYNGDSVMPQGYQQLQRNRAQGTEVNGQFVPTFSNPDGSYMSEGKMVYPQQPQVNMPLMRNNFGGAGVNFNIPNGQPQPMQQQLTNPVNTQTV